MACFPLGSEGRWVEKFSLEVSKINLQMDGLGRPFCEVSRWIESKKGEHRDSATFGNRTSLYQVGIQQVPSSKCLYIPQLIDRYMNVQKLRKDSKGLQIYMTVNCRRVCIREDCTLRADRTLISWETELLRNGKLNFRKRSSVGKRKGSLRRAQHLPRLSCAPRDGSADLIVTSPPESKTGTSTCRFCGKFLHQELSNLDKLIYLFCCTYRYLFPHFKFTNKGRRTDGLLHTTICSCRFLQIESQGGHKNLR